MKDEYDEIYEMIGELSMSHAQTNGERILLEKCISVVSAVRKKRAMKKDTVVAYSSSESTGPVLQVDMDSIIRKEFTSYDDADKWVMDTFSPEYTAVCPGCGAVMGVN